MRIEFTVDAGSDRYDIAVTAATGATVSEVLPAVAHAVGRAGASALWLGDHALAGDAQFGSTGVRTGVLVGLDRPGRPGARPAVLSLHVVGGPEAGQARPLERGRLTIGRDPAADLYLADPDISRRHALIEVGHAVTVRDLGSTNGTWVEGLRVGSAAVELRPGSIVRLGDSLLAVTGPVDTPATLRPGPGGTRHLVRPPRRAPLTTEQEIALPVRSVDPRPRGGQWLAALLPAVAGCALAWFAGSPQFLLFALLSPLMMVSTTLGDRLHWRRSRRREAASFARRRRAAEQAVAAGLAAEAAARRYAHPDPAAVARTAALPGRRIWERHRGDPDLLVVRLGTADRPSELQVREGATVRPAGSTSCVPVAVDLRAGPLGVAGPAEAVDGLSRWLVGQLAAGHSPDDLDLALLLGPDRANAWGWARWLPQVAGRVATSVEQWPALVAEVSALVDQRRSTSAGRGSTWSGAWLVVVVDRAARLTDVPGLATVLGHGAGVGVTAIVVDEDAAGLPNLCRSVARVHGETGTRALVRRTPADPDLDTLLDRVSPAWAEQLARDLAPLADSGPDGRGAVPSACGLLEVLALDARDADAVQRRWSASTGTARTVLGLSGDGPVEIDLATDGPHALVAGTTGAGKSELLQTLVAGLAANQPPDDINFLLIDYKGGAAFADAVRLPHTAGLVTDLDPYLTERALRSLHSELRRRERLLAAASAPDLTAYRGAARGEPIPRLVIVVDEFATLAEELPDFVRGLIGVAQRGRSLGVHLVLATQRPGNSVSAEIRANTSLRIALRMTDATESTDVIDAPDAAAIERATPGRAYLRIGSALTRFQTAHATAVTEPDRSAVRVEVLGPWRRSLARLSDPGAGDIARLVEALRTAAESSGRPSAASPWLPPLPDSLPLAALGPSSSGPHVPLARVDLPTEQRHATMSFDPAQGDSLLVAGAVRSGRSEVVTAVALGAAARCAPAELVLYVIDGGGGVGEVARALPHAATVLGPDESGLADRLLARLERECARRAGEPGWRADDAPALALLVDGWDRLMASLPDLEAGACSDVMTRLLRVGPASGLGIVVTGDRSTLAPRFSSGFGARVALRLGDRSDYGLVGISSRDVPAAMPPGRGLRALDGAALQFAHAGARPGRTEALRAAQAIAARWPSGERASLSRGTIRLRPLPAAVRLDELPDPRGRLALGLVGDERSSMAIDPFAGSGRLLVAGPPRSGRSTALRLLVTQARVAGLRTVVAAPGRSPLVEAARALGLPTIDPHACDVGPVPDTRTLLLVDDSEAFVDTSAGDQLTAWLRSDRAPLAAVVAGRSEDLAVTYRGVAAEVRRSHCGILLRPGPVDGDLLGVRLPRRPSSGPPGRGVAVGDPAWGPLFDSGEPQPIQVATP